MFATIELQKQAVADRYYHQLHPKPWAKSPEEAAWALMQRIMGLVGEPRSSGAVSDQVRDGREPQDRQGARADGAASILLRADEVIE